MASRTGVRSPEPWVLTGFDAFDLLYVGRCLPADSAAEILINAAERALCQ